MLRVAVVMAFAILLQGQDVQALITQFDSTDPEVARASREDLSRLGKKAASEVALLLHHPDAYFRWKAAEAAALLGKAAHSSTPALRSLLSDRTPEVRAAAARALASVGDTSAVPELLSSLKSARDPAARAALAAALGKLAGSASEDVIEALVALVPSTAAAAGALADLRAVPPELIPLLEQRALGDIQYARALGAAGAPALPAMNRVIATRRAALLINMLTEAGPVGRPFARLLLSAVERAVPGSGNALARVQATDAIPALQGLLHGSSLLEAATALIGLGHPDAAVEPLLTVVSREPRAVQLLAQVRSGKVLHGLSTARPAGQVIEREIVTALAALAPDSIPILGQAAVSDDVLHRARAMDALIEIGEPAVPVLLKLLSEPRLDPRRIHVAAAEALAGIGPAAHSAIPRLSANLDASDAELRAASAQAIAAAGPEGRRILREKIQRGDTPSRVKVTFIAALADGMPEMDDASLLTRLSHSAEPGIARSALSAIARSPALACLSTQSEDLGATSSPDRRAAFAVVAACRQPPSSLLPALTAALSDKDVYIRRLAALGIRQIGNSAAPATHVLISALRDPDLTVRRNAIGALGAIGPAASEALPALRSLLQIQEVRNYADCAIHQITESIAASPTMGFRAAVPAFSWPPYTPAARFSVPADWFGSGVTLRDIHRRISAALDAGGYFDRGVYALNDGFAMVTAVERIRGDGAPYTDDYRWTQGRIPVGLMDVRAYLESLLRGQNHMYRMLVFAITGQGFEARPGPLNPEVARKWVYATGDFLPQSIAMKPFDGLNCHVLIYTFSDRSDSVAAIPGRTHLERAGIYSRLREVAR